MDPAQALLPYLPTEIRQSLASGVALAEHASGAALFADLSGFTAMSAALARRLGPSAGAEALARQLDRYFETLVCPVHDFRGSVVGFGGDAITCWFDDVAGSSSGARRALAAAGTMRSAVEGLPPLNSPGQAIPLVAKFGLASGSATRVIVGDPAVQRLEVLVGQTIDRMAAAEQVAHGGEIVASEELVREAADALDVLEWRVGAFGQRFAVIADSGARLPSEAWPPCPGVTPELLRGWIHAKVAERILRGEGRFLNGFRPVVALFFRFTGIDYDSDRGAASKLDAVVRGTQGIVDSLGGQLIDVIVGDKGSYLFVAFGALKAHEDDARRAVAAARDLQELALTLPFLREAQIGISRGEDYVGAYGCAARRTFGVVGSEVNLAARLMTVAGPGEVVVTQRVAEAAAGHFEFEALAARTLKGLSDPIVPFALRGARPVVAAPQPATPGLFGRDAEKAALESALVGLRAGRGAHLILEGEAGIGKSRLIAWVLERARELGVTTFRGAADGLLRGAPYHAWRPVLFGILGLDAATAGDVRSDRVTADGVRGAVEELGVDDADLAPLLGAVLGIDLEETERTRAMDPEVRAQATRSALADLVLARARNDLLLVVIEDLHWLDSASAALLRLLSRHRGPLLLVATQRPLAQQESRALEDELSGVSAEHLELGPLAPHAIDALLRERLGAGSLPPSLSKLVERLAQGSPFFSQEIAFALRDRGLIEITPAGECRLSGRARDLDAIDFPDSVQGVITSRIDNLPPAHQLALKVASVLGTTFDASVLSDVHPVASDRGELGAILEHLVEANLLTHVGATSGPTHAFRHALTRDVAYGLLLREQRIEMHGAVLRWYERRVDDQPGPLLRVLAHHAARAVDAAAPDVAAAIARAIHYLDQAGAQALASYANEEVIEFLDEAVRLDGPRQPARGRIPEAGDPLFRNARWHESLARAHAALGDLESSRRASERCLQLLGHPMPDRVWRMFLGVAGQVAVQISRRAVGRGPGSWTVSAAERPALELVNAVRWLLSKALYHESHPAPHLYLNLQNLNLAERLGHSPELGIAYSVMQMTLAVLGMHGAAESYSGRALSTARAHGRQAEVGTALLNDGICRVGVGDWARAAASLGEARELALTSRHDQLFEEAGAVEADAAIFQGDLAGASALYEQVYQVAKKRGSLLHMGWCIRAAAVAALRAGRWDEVVKIVHEGAALRSQVADPLTEIDAQGMLAMALSRRGDAMAAWQAVERVAALAAATSPPVAYPRLLGLTGATEACLDILEESLRQGSSVVRREEVERAAKRLCAALDAYAATFPIGVPAARLQRGRHYVLLGRKRRAARCCSDAIAAAERLKMRYDLGTAHLFAARYDIGSGGDRERHLDAALATLGGIEASFSYSLAAGLTRSPAAERRAAPGR